MMRAHVLDRLCALAALSLLALACENDETATQVMLMLDAQSGVRAEASRYLVRVEGGASVSELAKRFESEVKASALPARLALAPRAADASRVFAVTFTAFADDGGPLAQARLVSGYVAGELRSHRLVLESSCLRKAACEPDQTCARSECDSAWVAPDDLAAGLPDYGEPLDTRDARDGSTGDSSIPTVDGGFAGDSGSGGQLDSRDSGGAAPDSGRDSRSPFDAGADTALNAENQPKEQEQDREQDQGGQALPEAEPAGTQPCLDGYEGLLEPSCTPWLLSLQSSRGSALSPAFDPKVTEYTLALWPNVGRFQLQVGAPDGAEVVIDGSAVPPERLFESSVLDAGPLDQSLSILVRSGKRPSRHYTLHVQRGVSVIAQAAPGLGHSVAASGEFVAVGAPFDDGEAGAVHVYQRDAGGGWTERAHIKGRQPGAQLGFSIALDGDTLIAGAPSEVDGDGVAGGAAHVFTRNAAGWGPDASEQVLHAAAPDAEDQFGAAVAVAGGTVVVGANGEASGATGVDGDATNNDAPGAGAAYVFEASSGTFEQTAYLKASNAAAGADFGAVVSISGEAIAVGAQFDSSEADRSGAVYMFELTAGGGISQVAHLKAPNADASDRFGRSVSLLGDRLMIGAPEEDGGGTGVDPALEDNMRDHSGAGYIFERDPSTRVWRYTTYLKGDHLGLERAAGVSVALGDDVAVLATPNLGAAEGISAPGGVFLFLRTAQGWEDVGHYAASSYGLLPYFGEQVAVASFGIVAGATIDKATGSGSAGVFLMPLPPAAAGFAVE